MPEGSGLEKEMLFGQEMINDCLKKKHIPADISLITLQDLIRQAPKNETFTVPIERYRATFQNDAKGLGRKDLKFVLGGEGAENE